MHSLMKRKVGIFGGAFNPPHRGHEKALETFLRVTEADVVYVIPSGLPPHKAIAGNVKDEDRLEMARLAFSPLSDRVRVSDLEIASPETSYTCLTVEKIRALHPDAEILLFIGTDQLLSFETWRNIGYLFEQTTLCVMDRFEDEAPVKEKIRQLSEKYHARFLLLEEKAYIISSTEIRFEIEDRGFSESLSPTVNSYIGLKGLYRRADPVREKLLARAAKELSPARLSHTLAVERECIRLCRLLACGEERELSLAALCHDLTKEKDTAEQIALLAKFGREPKKEDLLSPAVLHGMTASLLAKGEPWASEGAVSAIFYHTTGKENMTLSEKILYLADYMEETRRHPECIALRCDFYLHLPPSLSERRAHLDRYVKRAMENTILYLKEKNLPIHPLTLRAAEDLDGKEVYDIT